MQTSAKEILGPKEKKLKTGKRRRNGEHGGYGRTATASIDGMCGTYRRSPNTGKNKSRFKSNLETVILLSQRTITKNET
jgi:hypothetical protein